MNRKINFIISLVIALVMTSCVEQSGKYQTLVSQIDSLQAEKDSLESNYNETIDILNEVELGFIEISQGEKSVMLDVANKDGQPASKKQQIISKVTQIKETIADQQNKIDALQRRLNQSDGKNKSLAATIKRMQSELDEKTASIESLQQTLAKQNIKIEELSNTVASLNENVDQLEQQSSKQQATIKTQDTDLNAVYFCVANEKTLIEASIMEKGGLFKASKLLNNEFDVNYFTKSDRRELTSIPLNSKKVKLLSTHPSGSYTLAANEEGIYTLTIEDNSKFWSITKYLVIQTK